MLIARAQAGISQHMSAGYTLTLSGLLRKRAELGGQIDAMHGELAQRMAELHAVEATIRVFKPDIDLDAMPVRQVAPQAAAFRGEMARFFLDALRAKPEGLTTAELASAVMKARRLNEGDLQLSRLVLRRTGHSLKKLRDREFINSTKANEGGMLRWFIGKRSGEPVGGWRNGSSTPQIEC